MTTAIKLAHQNTVEILGTYGGDSEHACSAWTSTSRELTPEKVARIPALLKMLAENNHHSPFEKSSLHFLATTSLDSHIHLLKHRIGVSINSECLDGSSEITFVNTNDQATPKLRFKIEDLYQKWNTGRNNSTSKAEIDYQRKRLQRMKIRVLNEETNVFEYSHVKDITCSGQKLVYKITLSDGKVLKCSKDHRVYTRNGWSTISDKTLRVGVEVATNGIKTHVPSRPWTFPEYFAQSHEFTMKEFALKSGIKYELCKKWGYIHKALFKLDLNKDFKKEGIPWNKNIKGYTLNLSEESLQIRRAQGKASSGSKSHFWRGGITKERSLIGVWTTRNARRVHEKFNWTCQECGNGSSTLHAHHIVPVGADENLAYEFNNLITVCENCHHSIHKTEEIEKSFADKVLSEEFKPCWKPRKKRIGKKLSANYSKIVSIEELKEEKTFDIEIAGKWKNFVANGVVVHNSARYKELKDDKYYVPQDWNNVEVARYVEHMENSLKAYHECLGRLVASGMDRKRAKESARLYLPYGNQLTIDVMFNFRSFAHFLNLRYSKHAQLEIREIAGEMLKQVASIEGKPFEHTLRAFGFVDENGNITSPRE
jgi:thymidylate synthase (FAD)